MNGSTNGAEDPEEWTLPSWVILGDVQCVYIQLFKNHSEWEPLFNEIREILRRPDIWDNETNTLNREAAFDATISAELHQLDGWNWISTLPTDECDYDRCRREHRWFDEVITDIATALGMEVANQEEFGEDGRVRNIFFHRRPHPGAALEPGGAVNGHTVFHHPRNR